MFKASQHIVNRERMTVPAGPRRFSNGLLINWRQHEGMSNPIPTDQRPVSLPLSGTPAAAGVAALLTVVEQTLHTVRVARALTAAHRDVELSGLEHAVGLICAKALDLPPSDGQKLRCGLEMLLAECTALGECLVRASLVSSRQKAATCPSHSKPS